MMTAHGATAQPKGTRSVDVSRLGQGAGPDRRVIVEEMPIEIVYNGQSYAVMMTTPSELEDFVVGFTLSERLVDTAAGIRSLRLSESSAGWLAECVLDEQANQPERGRSRQRVGDSSCGLCGVGRLAQVHQPLPVVKARIRVDEVALFRSLESLPDWQPLNRLSGGVHAAALVDPSGRILLAREDVGRHNAFDKLIGAAAARAMSLARGYVLLSSRCSYELVEKAIIAGVPMLVTISAPTSLAVDRAAAHDLTLISLARTDAMLVMHDPHGSIRSLHSQAMAEDE